ncbi:unnamed protein product [Cylindrotheca closterium]|uniref:Uncharacterized protein n=1 Tax=Cylindrotheca closterium TaxID=2856 RepID=A0AAD2CTG8_9STRA|nr:unnamed protein product [Cylindrotheca closterium]
MYQTYIVRGDEILRLPTNENIPDVDLIDRVVISTDDMTIGRITVQQDKSTLAVDYVNGSREATAVGSRMGFCYRANVSEEEEEEDEAKSGTKRRYEEA